MIKYVKVHTYYNVELDGKLIGTVKNFMGNEWLSEDLEGKRYIKSTRKAAVNEMIKYIKGGN